MKKITIGILGTVALLMAFLIISFSIGVNYRNNALSLRKTYESQYYVNQTTYDSMWKKFKELTQVSDLQAEQVKEIYTEMISGRYQGDENVLFKLIAEDNPKLINTYSIIQEQIVLDRNTFNNEQRKMLDKVNNYNFYIEKHFILNMFFNYEPKNMKDFIITSEETEKTFRDKKSDEMKLK